MPDIYSPVGGRSRLFVRSMQTGETVALTAEGESPHDITWSPDGSSIAFIEFVPEAAAKLGDALVAPSGAHWAEPAKVIEGGMPARSTLRVIRRPRSRGGISSGFLCL